MKTKLHQASVGSTISPIESQELRNLYNESFCNAHELFNEGKLLAEHGHYARSVFLALTAREEMGKAQLIADYAQDCSSRQEFEKAFGDHRIKHAYMMRQTATNIERSPEGKNRVKEPTITYDLNKPNYELDLRERALYVSYQGTYDKLVSPSQISKEECHVVLDGVLREFSEIEHAERLNGRVGSKALFK